MCKDCNNKISCTMSTAYHDMYRLVENIRYWRCESMQERNGYVFSIYPNEEFAFSYYMYGRHKARSFHYATKERGEMFDECSKLRDLLYEMEEKVIIEHNAEHGYVF